MKQVLAEFGEVTRRGQLLQRYRISMVEPGDTLTSAQRVAAVEGGTFWRFARIR